MYVYDEAKQMPIQKTFENWDVTQFFYAEKQGLFFYIVNEDGSRKLKIATAEFKPLQNVNLGFDLFSIVAVDDSQENILLRAAKSPFPYELYHYNWKSGKFVRLTNFNKLKVPDNALVKPELFNGIAIIDVHGGPESNASQAYSEDSQYLVNQGFTVIQPNFRGSTGYGTAFQRKVYRDWGGGHIQDIMATRQYLVEQLKISEKRIAVVGGSFGGYTSAEVITQYPTSFCAASTEYAVLDVHQMIAETDEVYQKSENETIGQLNIDREKLKKVSPMFKIDQIQIPMLIVYGEEDKVVLKSQSELFIKKMSEKNKKFETIVYDNEGHGVSGYSNYQYYQKELPNFLVRNCK